MASRENRVSNTGKRRGQKRRTSDPISEIHQRFFLVMEERLATAEEHTRINYMTVMTSLTAKLEVPGKPLPEIVRELMSEAAPLLFAVMRG